MVALPPMEIERILHCQGFGSRKSCRSLVRQGRIRIDDQVCDNPWADVETSGLVFSVDGVAWPYRERATLALYKPPGFECSRRPVHHPSVYSLLPIPLLERGVQPIGRLDEDTTGLLLFTDDGRLNHVLTSPRHKIAKTYRVTLKHPVDPGMIESLLHGVVLRDTPDLVRAVACEQTALHELKLVISEGRYHQVKRMVAAAGNRVEALHRSAVGGFSLPENLLPGQWSWVESEDLDRLQKEMS